MTGSGAPAGELADRVVIVTGAGKGIGRAISLRLGAAGAHVVLAARDITALTETATALGDQPGRVGRHLVLPVDLSQPDSVVALADSAERHFGRIDILVNNSGIGGNSAPLWEVELTDWDQTLAVNLTGAFLACRAVLPAMLRQGSGSIVLIGSMTGKRPLLHRSPYASSKLGLVGLCRTLALDAAPHGIRVNLVSPGFVEGPRLDWVVEQQALAKAIPVDRARHEMAGASPLRRFTPAEDVAEAVLFLASDRAHSITGEDLNVSAGLVMY